MKAYKLSGKFLMKDKMQPFTKEMAAENEERAIEKTLSEIGSKHKVKRRFVKIENVSAMASDEITDLTVRYQVKGQ